MQVSFFDKRKRFAFGKKFQSTIRLVIIISCIFCFFQFSVSAQGLNSKGVAIIKIDPERTIAEIDPKIYGVFMEPIKAITAEVINTSGFFKGKSEVSVVKAESPDEPFTIEKQAQYVPVTKEIETGKNSLIYSFPPHSFTQLKVSVTK